MPDLSDVAAPSPPAAPPAPPLDPAAQTFAFMDALLGYAPPELHSLLWTLQDKRSSWVALDGDDGPQRVADRARELADSGKDVYVAVSLAGDKVQRTYDGRIKSANAAGIFGLWADLDIADPDVHKKWNLPPSIDAAMQLLTDCDLEPTLVVHSGHGLQAWWLFHEFWAFDTDDDRLAAAGLAQRWNATLQSHAAARQWVVDSTFDLARVMRVPGTLNRKGTPVMPVRLLKGDGPRWNPEDVEPKCRDENFLAGKGLTPTKQYVVDKIEYSDAAQPNIEKFQSLMDNVDGFEATFKMKRKDMSDQSPSSYDLALANFAAAAGWPDQEIQHLCHFFRRTHKLDTTKTLRPDYMERTIRKAREKQAKDAALGDALEEVGEALEEAKRSGDPEAEKDARRAALDVIGSQLGLEVLHFHKYLSDPPAFALVTPIKTIQLGGADGILVWAKFKQAVWETVGHQIDRMRPAEWDQITALIPQAWEEQDVGAEATERGEVASWLTTYLAQRPPVDSLQEAATSEYPFVADDGRVVMFGPAFKRWLWLTYQERITPKELGRRLRDYGCEPDKVNVEDADGKRTTRGVWRLPRGLGS